MKLTFLGTQSMQPTRKRGLPSMHISLFNENILLDCGEGTQRQMRIASVKPTKLTSVLISHFHADHILGLAGLLRNLSANQYQGALYVYGPKGLGKYLEHLIKSSLYNPRIQMKIIEVKKPGVIFEDKNFMIEAQPLFHSVDCLCFIFKEKDRRKINLSYTKKFGLTRHPLLGELQRGKNITFKGKKILASKATKIVPGKKYVFIQDTAYNTALVKYAKGADLLVSESTFQESEKAKAKEYTHMTSSQAATVAKKAKVKKLVLTHFSQRYENLAQMKKEAKKVFKNTEIADDFMVLDV